MNEYIFLRYYEKFEEFLQKEIDLRLPDFSPEFIICGFDFTEMRNAIWKIEKDGGKIVSFCISTATLKQLEKMVGSKPVKVKDRIIGGDTLIGYRLIVNDNMNDKNLHLL